MLSNYYQYTVHSTLQVSQGTPAVAVEYPGLARVEPPSRSHRVKPPPAPKSTRVKPPPEPATPAPAPKAAPAVTAAAAAVSAAARATGSTAAPPRHHSHRHATNTEHFLRESDKQAERDAVTDELRREARKQAAAAAAEVRAAAAAEVRAAAAAAVRAAPQPPVEVPAAQVVSVNDTGRQNFTNWTLMGLSSADVELKEMNRFLKRTCTRPCFALFVLVQEATRMNERRRRCVGCPVAFKHVPWHTLVLGSHPSVGERATQLRQCSVAGRSSRPSRVPAPVIRCGDRVWGGVACTLAVTGETERECVPPHCLCKFTDAGCRQRWCERNRRVTLMPMRALGFPVAASDRTSGHYNILDFIRFREGGKFSKELPADMFPRRGEVFKVSFIPVCIQFGLRSVLWYRPGLCQCQFRKGYRGQKIANFSLASAKLGQYR